ncbi:MAG: beta-lactamase family protein [Phycisphaerales bacterium]|nr:MAG: beta-lactamase family protein [Phycisphaerales bacterium]
MISLGDYVFDLTEHGQSPPGLLNYAPFPELGDQRLKDITIQNLLDHQSGWDPDDDPTYMEIEIASAMGTASPPGRIRTARYIMGMEMQVAPGTPDCVSPNNPQDCYDGRQYSNAGYMMLGLIIEQESGMDYIDFVRQHVFGPIPGETGRSLEVGKPFKDEQNSREPWYDNRTWKPNVFDPNGPYVFWPYGGWDHEARVAQGGLIADTETLLRFLEYYPGGHSGSMPAGSRALTRQRGDGINYVVLFNKREMDGDSGYCADGTTCMGDADCAQGDCERSWATLVRIALDDVINAGGIAWPTRCVDGTWVDFNHQSPGAGNFDNPYNAMGAGLANTPYRARMRIKGGSTHWAGTIGQRVELHAPLGSAVIGW